MLVEVLEVPEVVAEPVLWVAVSLQIEMELQTLVREELEILPIFHQVVVVVEQVVQVLWWYVYQDQHVQVLHQELIV
tara:strand:+ start:371 stop:601 length:231 start_codon:yes stop_codon:yes gene_type:complete